MMAAMTSELAGVSRGEQREAIVRTSLELGAEYGEEGLTIRGIAAKLGISVTVLYQHFDSKAEILREIRLRGLKRLLDETITAFDRDDLRASILETSHAYVRFAREQPWLYRVLFEGDELPTSVLADDQRETVVAGHVNVREAMLTKFGQMVTDPARLARNVARWWSGLHGLCGLVIHNHLVPDHALLPVPDLDAFIADYLEFLTDSLIRAQ
jgi:AcrR family transcriptional regulator